MWSASSLSEDLQFQALRRMKLLAGLLLLLVAALYFISHRLESTYPALAWLRAFSEAAMIGGLADWFAVTALFRHPLGLKIPHTAIIPRSQERIADTIGVFFKVNFLSQQIVSEKLQNVNLAVSFAHWASDRRNADKISKNLVALFPEIVALVDDRQVREFLVKIVLGSSNQGKDLVRMGAYLAEAVLAADRQERLFSQLIALVAEMVQQHEAFLKNSIASELPWYVPRFVHDRVYQSLIERLQVLLAQIKSDPQHPYRINARVLAEKLIQNLKTSEAHQQRFLEQLKELGTQVSWREVLSRCWNDFTSALQEDAANNHHRIEQIISQVVLVFSQKLGNEPEIQKKLNHAISAIIGNFLDRHSDDFGKFIATTVRNWQSETLVEKVELQIGKDLQYIRLNGTLVGGLVGLLLYSLSLLV